ncbi:MAG: T9SS type A sorting domain-containing protein [Chitinophagales bacterium]
MDIALDALSPIYILNAHEVHTATHDTLLRIKPGDVPCINLNASTAVSQYDSAAWYYVTKNGKQFFTSGLSAQVCTDSNMVFIVALRDTAPNCAGPMWSYDTLRIWVRDTVLGISETAAASHFEIRPNPAHDVLTIQPSFEAPYAIEVMDDLGRICINSHGRKEKQLDISSLSRGAYLIKVAGVARRFLKE